MNKEILRQAIPNILTNLTVPLLSLTDTVLMGHRASGHYILAIGLGSMIFTFMYWGFGFLRMGTTGMTAQAFGRDDKEEIRGLLQRALCVSLSIGLLLLLFSEPLRHLALWLIDTDAKTAELISEYFRIRIFAAPAAVSAYVFIGWFMGMQNARIPMLVALAVNLFNLIADIYLVEFADFGIAGAAYGTVGAQYFGILIYIIYLLKSRPGILRFRFRELIEAGEAFREFFLFNADILLRTLVILGVMAYFKVRAGEQLLEIAAVNMLLIELLDLLSYGTDGFAFAAEAVVGKYAGAGDKQNLRKAIRLSFLWGLAAVTFFSLIYSLLGTQIMQIFTDKTDIIAASEPYLFYLSILPFAAGAAYIWDGIFVGLTASKAMRNTVLYSAAVFFPAIYFLIPAFGNHGLWISMLLFMIVRSIIQTVLGQKVLKGFL